MVGSCFFIQPNEELVSLFDYWEASVTAKGTVSPNKSIPHFTGRTCGDGGQHSGPWWTGWRAGEYCCIILAVPTWDRAEAHEGRPTLWGPCRKPTTVPERDETFGI